jgi:hypothetical protein
LFCSSNLRRFYEKQDMESEKAYIERYGCSPYSEEEKQEVWRLATENMNKRAKMLNLRPPEIGVPKVLEVSLFFAILVSRNYFPVQAINYKYFNDLDYLKLNILKIIELVNLK